MTDSVEDIARDIRAVSQLDAVPTLLQVLCDTTEMGFAAVARVTDERWVACAVKDTIGFGLQPGGELDVNTTLCIESRQSRAPIIIDHASADARYSSHHTPKLYHIESYISVPIVMPDGRYFGNLCAIDPKPAKVSEPRIVSMFTHFAQLIALQLDNELTMKRERTELRDERAASELREQFIAILGHDLRNPLSAIYATCRVMERKLTDPLLLELAARLDTSARRMSALIDDVLDFARARLGGGIGIQIGIVADINSSLIAVVRELQDAHPNRQVVCDINVRRAVRCDVGRIQQVVSNLIGNALVHGSAQSSVKVTAFADATDFVVEVWNDGEPIPPESLGKIFEPFWRHSTSSNRQGLGLGLHISSQIVHAHGGRLFVTSSKETGTLFTARLPLEPMPEQTGN